MTPKPGVRSCKWPRTVVHRGADVALRAQVLRPIVRKVVVRRREVPAHAERNGKARPPFPTPGLRRFESWQRTRRARRSCRSPGRTAQREGRARVSTPWSVHGHGAGGAHVADRRELVGEVRAAGVGGVEVRLDDQSQTPANVAWGCDEHVVVANGGMARFKRQPRTGARRGRGACGAATSACATRPRTARAA